ncbi:30S ribosome-binding factor RbfA [Halocynthiibacter styelae]|uniref:Ribosome-binding factor A n=1 Tax=Halocynthiibacter styelae TaxID=2761955 RepID=A0A8J7IJ14_9RHOB|nr:30S ribosome-binding factor RbfA [Paenihalocynthiibacter styelae]MBI1493778.1 30S ribosome-binding factor RbfA [Paenihalocynthiibacter styelae]
MAKNSHNAGRGPSQRQLRVGELIRRNLSEILMRGDIHDPDLNRISITVGEVRCTPDLHIATAFILPLGGEGAEDALSLLRKNRHEIRRMIGKKMALKHTPELRYEIDMTFDQMDATRRLLDNDKVKRDVALPDEEGDI